MRLSLALAGAAIAVGTLLGGAALLPTAADQAPRAAAPATDSADGAALLPSGNAIQREEALRARIASRPDDAVLWAQLGASLLGRARDEADPSHLPHAEAALRQSLRLQRSGNVAAFVGMAALGNARHDFSGSVIWARRAIASNPYNASAHGLLGDALFELGHVRASEAAYQRMVDLRPDTASYMRASYALQHRGEHAAALRTMKLARQAAGPAGQSAAFVQHQLGDLYAARGQWAKVERANRDGIAVAPGFIPPTVGLAESYIGRGQLRRAIPLLERAVAQLPTLEYLAKLGDLYTAVGRDDDAAAVYDRGAATLAAFRRNGVKPDADLIVFYATHHLRPEAALPEAFAMYRNRPTPKVADALAWMLHSVGRDAEARRYAQQAISVPGVSGAELFHAAQIERALGHDGAAAQALRHALDSDPTFSVVDAPVARRQLEELS